MTFTTPQDAIGQMSACAAQGTPFLFAFDFEMSQALFIARPLEQHEVLFQTPLGGNGGQGAVARKFRLSAHPSDYESYRRKFDVVRQGLLRGDSFLTNLTVRTPIECDLSLPEIFASARAPYRLLVPGRFVSFSPEIFVRIADGTISTFPMKGTIDASVPDAAERILADAKETAEHITVVDLLRNDLGIGACDVGVRRFRYIDRIDTPQRSILQVSSEIEGRLPAHWRDRLGEIIADMLPAGSVSGAPKGATLRLIRQAEGMPRGFYAGVFGYFDGCELDSAVLIRYIEQDGGRLYFRSGGGITVNSDCRAEYNEIVEKIYIPAT